MIELSFVDAKTATGALVDPSGIIRGCRLNAVKIERADFQTHPEGLFVVAAETGMDSDALLPAVGYVACKDLNATADSGEKQALIGSLYLDERFRKLEVVGKRLSVMMVEIITAQTFKHAEVSSCVAFCNIASGSVFARAGYAQGAIRTDQKTGYDIRRHEWEELTDDMTQPLL